MVENLTDKNLQLEEELGQLTETVNDLVSVTCDKLVEIVCMS